MARSDAHPLGASGRRMLQALAAGVSDPVALASLADRRLQASAEELRDALAGQIAQCLKAQREAIQRLCEIPGASVGAAHQVIAEMGFDAQAFPSAAHAASWVGVCPGRDETAGRSSSDASPYGNRAMRRIVTQIAWGAVRTKDSFFQALFKRLTARLGVQKALWAVAHRLVQLIWKVLHDKARYVERGPLNLDPQARERRKRNLLRQLRRLGYAAILAPLPSA